MSQQVNGLKIQRAAARRAICTVLGMALALAMVVGQPLAAMAGARSKTPVTAPVADANAKKLIEFGWDVPSVSWLVRNLPSHQDLPFDGFVFTPTNRDRLRAFEPAPWGKSDINLGQLDRIAWGKYTETFVLLWASGDTVMDWRDNARWATVLQNMRLLSKAVSTAGARGVFFDPEFYSNVLHPWSYSAERYPGLSFTDVEAIVRSRGAEFVQALASAAPDIRILSTYLASIPASQAGLDRTKLAGTSYALLAAFTEGMLEGASERVMLIDGQEGPAYGYDETQKFAEGYRFVKDRVAGFIDPSVRDRYDSLLRVGEPVFLDMLYGVGRFDRGYPLEYRQAWLQHNVYNALLTTDEYAWFYSEQADWWRDWLPQGVRDAVTSARSAFSADQALGFDMVKSSSNYLKSVPARLVSSPATSLTSETDTSAGPGATLSFTVTASQAVRVVLLVDSREMASSTQGPFAFDLSGLATGTHVVVARGFTASGDHTSSNPVTVQIAS